jgi:polyphosphate kinase
MNKILEPEIVPSPSDHNLELDDPNLYLNRELSWIRFNRRVLGEAMDRSHPLLERIKFLAICGSNLDEFFMCRLSAIRKRIRLGISKLKADAMTEMEVIEATRREILPLLENYAQYWHQELIPALKAEKISIRSREDLSDKERTSLRQYFEQMILPTLTPLAIDLAHPFPFISNLSLNIAVVLKNSLGEEKYARVKVPSDLFPRLLTITSDHTNHQEDSLQLIFLEDVIAMNADLLFPGLEIITTYLFRVTRDAEIEIIPDEYDNLLEAVEHGLKTRETGLPIRLEVEKSMPQQLTNLFALNLNLSDKLVYQIDKPFGLVDLWQLHGLDLPQLKDQSFIPYIPEPLKGEQNLFEAIAKRDWVLYHPYDDFTIIVNLLQQAAQDPSVLAIKITMYRIDKKSPIIDALMKARENGKNVAVLVELKAKFDEKNNINWAKKLEHAGVHVIYGLPSLKVHTKLCLIVRKEKNGIVEYAHLSSGNYHTFTSKIYGDMAYLTANPAISRDVGDLFNALTGYSEKSDYQTLLVAPKTLENEILKRIDREIAIHEQKGNGYIAFKLNGLVDADIIKSLYRASRAGVKIDLNVRGLCCLRPRVAGVSDNIQVISIVGRFLEHTRIYYFNNDGQEEVLLGSSDMMPRNLSRRVEVLFPVLAVGIKTAIINNMLKIHLQDNVKAWRMLADGSYEKVEPAPGEEKLNSQQWLIDNRGIWHQ